MQRKTGCLDEFLRSRLDGGGLRVGQVWVVPSGEGVRLSHEDDVGHSGLAVSTDPHEAIQIVRYDDAGKYRPLKTAPNLRRGWRIDLTTRSEILLALDFLYPGALATAEADRRNLLEPVDLRRTLARQSGMYAVVRKIDDAQAQALVQNVCRGDPGCLRRILWNISSDCALSESLVEGTLKVPDSVPLICAEACNLLVAAGRDVVKGKSAEG
jgi:sirohydrochlorin cobaltochelatase